METDNHCPLVDGTYRVALESGDVVVRVESIRDGKFADRRVVSIPTSRGWRWVAFLDGWTVSVFRTITRDSDLRSPALVARTALQQLAGHPSRIPEALADGEEWSSERTGVYK